MNKTAVFFITIVALIAGVLVGVTIGEMFATKLKAAVLLSAVSILIGYMVGLGTSAVLYGTKAKEQE